MKGNELKPHIGIFGRRNYGKSSLINYLTGQQLAIVSATPGTTTDPVKKSMEIGGIGPVVLIDTAGLDDLGTLGQLRVQKSMQVLPQCNLAIILVAHNRFDQEESDLVSQCQQHSIPFLIVCSLADVEPPRPEFLDLLQQCCGQQPLVFSALQPGQQEALLARIRQLLPESAYRQPSMLQGIVAPGDMVVMVTPIDSSAPEGRMILPQVQVLRNILDLQASAVVCQPDQLQQTLARLSAPPRIVITDSQAFAQVAAIVPQNILLTSFSIILARAKGLFDQYIQGLRTIDALQAGDRVLMLESCTHNTTCEDIGRVKLPRLLQKYTGLTLQCECLGGQEQPSRPLSDYRLVIQCGGCVVTEKQLYARLQPFLQAQVPVTNYGLALAHLNGITQRALQFLA